MESHEDGGRAVAAKQMPNSWIMTGPRAFQAKHHGETEQPWYDLGLLQLLTSSGFPYTVRLEGIFRDDTSTYVVTSLATRGDLFSWSVIAPDPGPGREALMRPIAEQIFTAVEWLHELGVAHRDLSLENVLLTDRADGELQVQIIDFGAATLSRRCWREARGKPSYQAPEVHGEAPYDSFLADSFSLGVLLYGMATPGYPWTCTKRGVCRLFEYVCCFGLRKYLEERVLQRGRPARAIEVFSTGFVELLEGLLELRPQRRWALGESCLDHDGRPCVWHTQWFDRSGVDLELPGWSEDDEGGSPW
mmetsp:Transcript_84734/g.263206  ORF Transcript_84734/g.263206 Transcript_84734/m.263206 type:complete len:304 (-) Transcript_84734:78-989(-)